MYHFPIEQYTQSFYLDPYILVNNSYQDYLNSYSTSFTSKFAKGSQTLVDKTNKSLKLEGILQPTSLIDHIKHALINWEPTLNFGWLTPKYSKSYINFEYTESSSYVNVYPLPTSHPGRFYTLYEHSLSPVEWLNAKPVSRESVSKAHENIREAKYSAQMAMSKYSLWSYFENLFKDENNFYY